MQVSQRAPLSDRLALPIVNFLVAAVVVWIPAAPYYQHLTLQYATWSAQAIVWALAALLLGHTRSIRLALAALLPVLQGYVVLSSFRIIRPDDFDYELESMLLLGIVSVTCTAGLTLAEWLFGWRLTRDDASAKSGAVRFQLRDLVAWTLAVSVPLTFFRLFDMDQRLHYKLLNLLQFVAVLFAAGGPATVLLLQKRIGAVTIAVMLLLFACVTQWLYFFNPYPVNTWFFMITPLKPPVWIVSLQEAVKSTAAFALVLIVNLLTIRGLGYRWRRTGKGS